MTPWDAAFVRIPLGRTTGRYDGRHWHVVKTEQVDGRSLKLVAEELGGPGFLSLNVYALSDGRLLLRPCEVDREAAEAFIVRFEPGTL